MKKFLTIFAAAAVLLSCTSLKEEWQPVFTFGDNIPEPEKLYTEATLPGFPGTFTTISDFKAMYKGGGVEIDGNIWIKGQVISDDHSGNIYRELYIQDETGGIDLKLGKSSLYSEYDLGQWIYVYCNGLMLGAYNGMPQLGLPPDETSTNEYETSYIDVQTIIDQHFFKGPKATPLAPVDVTAADLRNSINKGFTGELWGKLVRLDGLTYGNEIFCLIYPNPNLPHKSGNPENRVFLSDGSTWGIDTWAMSKAKMLEYIDKPIVTATDDDDECIWDIAQVGSGSQRYGAIATTTPRSAGLKGKTLDSFGDDADLTYKEIMKKYASANYVSHYFNFGGLSVQVRTSGYAKFSDEKIDIHVLMGEPVSITGILTIYNGDAQISLIDEPAKSVQLSQTTTN